MMSVVPPRQVETPSVSRAAASDCYHGNPVRGPRQRQYTIRSSNHSISRRTRDTPLLWFVRGTVVIFMLRSFVSLCTAMITIPATGERYSSHIDTLHGRHLYNGEQLEARMQYIPQNFALCSADMMMTDKVNNNNNNNNQNAYDWPFYNVTVPTDGRPVALLIRGGRCTIEEKLDNVLNRIYPRNVVRFVIIGDTRNKKKNNRNNNNSNNNYQSGLRLSSPGTPLAPDGDNVYTSDHDDDASDQKVSWLPLHSPTNRIGRSVFHILGMDADSGSDDEPIEWHDRLHDDDLLRQLDSLDGDSDYPFYVLHVSMTTHLRLLDKILHESEVVRTRGGTQLVIDGRIGTGGIFSADSALWLALSALLSACACSFLLIVHGHQQGWWEPDMDPPPQQPIRPTRRRLTREQVKRLLPQYRYDGTRLVLIMTEDMKAAAASRETSDATDVLAAGTSPLLPPPSPEPIDLSMCSICLDDYEAGDRMRCLPCNHTFHSKCIGKWLTERSATCPLCKIDLWQEEEEEEEEGEGQDLPNNTNGMTHGGPHGTIPASDSDTLDSWWHRVFAQLRQDEHNRAATLERFLLGEPTSPAPAAAPPPPPLLPLPPTSSSFQPLLNAETTMLAAATAADEHEHDEARLSSLSSSSSSWWRRLWRSSAMRRHSIPEGAALAMVETNTLTEPLLSQNDHAVDMEAAAMTPSSLIWSISTAAAEQEAGAAAAAAAESTMSDATTTRTQNETPTSMMPGRASSFETRVVSV